MKKDSEMQKRVDYFLKRIASEYRITLEPHDHPSAHISQGDKVSYAPELNYLHLREEDMDDAEVLGEEAIGHPLRRILRQYALQRELERNKKSFRGRLKATFGKYYSEQADYEEDDSEVSEFFGYVGRKMLERIAKPEDDLKFKKKRKPIPVLEKHKPYHQTGYKFAQQIDLDKITDFQEFFSLPSEEIKKRFFTFNPQYDLSKPAVEAKELPKSKEKALENILKLIFIPLIIVSVFLAARTITGMVVGINSPTGNFISILTLIILVTVYSLIKLRKN